jgi:hypothetical protein
MKPIHVALPMLAAIALVATACGGTAPPAASAPTAAAATAAPTAAAATAAPAPTTAAATAVAAATSAPAPTSAASANTPAAVQVRYDLLSFNVQAVAHAMDRWKDGDDAARTEMSASLDHINTALDFTWPDALQEGVSNVKAAIKSVDDALHANDPKAADKAVDDFSEAFHTFAHPYYGKWMEGMMSGGMMMNTSQNVAGTYIDLALNLADLSALMDTWTSSGDDGARSEAGERIERLNTLLTSVTWPPDTLKGVQGFHDALPALNKALKAKDKNTAKQALGDVTEAFDGLSHPYYGKFLANVASTPLTDPIAIQAAFADIGVNMDQLDDSLNEWKNGSDDARTEASERLERMETLLNSVQWPDTLSKAALDVKARVMAMDRPLKAKDQNKSATAFSDLEAAYDTLAQPFYPFLASAK